MKNQEVGKAVQRMAGFTALLYYHLTKAMIDEYGDDAKAVIKKAIKEFGLERGQNIAKKVLENGEELTIANLDKYYDMPISQGWEPSAEYKEKIKRSTTESCVFAQVWIEKAWQEVGHIYCEVDPAIREGYNTNIEYTPDKNLLMGDSFCSSVTRYKNS